jgi:SAM-dependent methyltransferase
MVSKEKSKQQSGSNARRGQADYSVTAKFYDLLYAEQSALDLPLYRELAASAHGSVLELGCGTGRVALALTREGHDVVALDNSQPMLEQFKANLSRESESVRSRVRLIEGSMVDFNLSQRFGLILAPFRAFQHLLTPDVQRQCLMNVSRHLEPSGTYVHNIFNPNLKYIVKAMQAAPTWQQVSEHALPEKQGIVRRYVQLQPRPGQQQHEISWKYEEYNHQGVLQQTSVDSVTLRWQYRWEAEYLLELSGLEISEAYGAYDRRPLDENAGELIYLCHRRI